MKSFIQQGCIQDILECKKKNPVSNKLCSLFIKKILKKCNGFHKNIKHTTMFFFFFTFIIIRKFIEHKSVY